MKEKLICIGGGVGPMAGVELHKKIIENTKTNGTDQDHLEVHHFSRSHDIGDRTKYLLGEIEENPAEGMLRTARAAKKVAQVLNKFPIIGVPCNTFHSPKIFNRFLELLKQNNIDALVLNMIKETGQFIKQMYPDAKKIGLMSTTGARHANVYNEVLEPFNFKIIEVPLELQWELHDSIYNRKWGIKAVSPVSKQSRDNFLRYANLLAGEGAEVIILGCTEIPLVLPESHLKGVPLVDPMTALARAFIREAAEEKLISLE